MSGHGFHVHGPHDHAVEHASHGGDNFASKIAVMTAILSTVGALFAYEGGATQNDALLHKNAAAIKKTEASNHWNYYQAKSNKQNLAELAVALNQGENKARYQQEVERYKSEKADIKKEAEALEKEVEEFNHKSDEAMHLHHRWAQAMTAIQVAISMAAITLLSRKKWLNYVTYTAAGAGAVLAGLALAHI
ncbi:MAG TPA: DUF4337 domain-containing protein [Rhodocyclaceae bacterium]|nr:DUF4337 domain-containing protein [Rhodocyclaceae bacterium]